MFGVWRTLLALCVVAFHLLLIPVIGEYAVFSFFVLSGFLMTTIMHDSYGYGLEGLRRYALNRFLRLYPAYWVAAAIGLLVIFACGEEAVRAYKPEIYAPDHLSAFVFNLAMIFPRLMPDEVWPRLSPPTWALTVEITYYVAIGLGVSRTKRRALIWLAASVAYVVATFALNLSPRYRYAAIPAGSLPFAAGACLYFYKTEARRLLQRLRVGLWPVAGAYLGLFLGFTVLSYLGHTGPIQAAGLYMTIAAACALITTLNFDGVPGVPPRLDKLVGDFSYPIYLLHWQLGAFSSSLLFHRPELGLSAKGLASFTLTLVLVGIVSAFIIRVIDPTVESLRTRIRQSPPLAVLAAT
jgi:peptidoglycan/LPS O-acetylase OafA/YrhL